MRAWFEPHFYAIDACRSKPSVALDTAAMTLLVFVLVLLLSYLFLKKWKQFSRWDHFPGASKFTSLVSVLTVYK